MNKQDKDSLWRDVCKAYDIGKSHIAELFFSYAVRVRELEERISLLEQGESASGSTPDAPAKPVKITRT